MKKNYFFIAFFYLILRVLAQTNMPSDFNIQFSLRKANGSAAANKNIRVQTLIFLGNSNLVYNKVFINLQTNAYGILSLKVSGVDNSNRNIPSAEVMALNEVFLQIKVDTIDVASANENGLFEVYAKQKFSSVPYAIAAQKAPGTFVYFDTPSDSIVNNNRGMDGDAALEISPTRSNTFPKFYFNKENNAWPNVSYSLLPNNASNTFKTIFYNESGTAANLKRGWEINNALTLNQKGLGINMPGTLTPSKALEVYGTLRFDTLRNLTGGNRMVVADQSGNVFTLPIPTIAGFPSGNQQGDMLYYNTALNTWIPTSLVQFKNNSLSVARNLEVADTIKANVTVLNSELFLNGLKNTSALDTAIYLSTNANGRLVSRRMNNFVWGIRGNNLSTFANLPFLGSTDASDLVFKTNNNQTMRMYGQAFGSTRFAGDIDVNNSLYVLKDISISDNVKFDANKFKNPAPLDSIRFLTTDANGNLNLHKIKFPTTSAALPNGTTGDLFFYNNGAWAPNSNVKINAAGSLFATKNITASDSIITNILNVKNDVLLLGQINPLPLDSTRFLTTDGTGKLTLHKVKFPVTSAALPNGINGDLFFYNNGAWAPNSNVKINAAGSLFAAKNITAIDSTITNILNVKNDVLLLSQINPLPLDSTRFLTTDGTGKLTLHKVKFPSAGGALPSGTQGDLFFYNNGSWAPSTNIKMTASGSLFANQNITATDSLLAANVKVTNDVVLSSHLNPLPLDSTRFLTTDGTGKLTLHKVKFPVVVGSLPSGTQGDLFFYDNGAWAPSTNIKMTAPGSLFANQNITATDSVTAANVKVKNDVILSKQLNPQYLDSSQFLTTDPTGKVVLQKVKIPVSNASTIATKFINVAAANQSFDLNDTTKIFVNHSSINTGFFNLNLPLASTMPDRTYEVFFGRPTIGLKPNFRVSSVVGFTDIYSFVSFNTAFAITETTTASIKVTLTSTYINNILGYKWIFVAQNIN